MKDGILTSLRAGTAEAHAQLERYVNMPWRAADMQRYAKLLECFLGWYEPMEAQLAALDPWPPGAYQPAERSKLPWLKSDLLALGRTPEQIAAIPRCQHLPKADSFAQGFGCAYVMEGATLGGRSITNMIATAVPEEARSFFQSYGSETRDRWLQFIGALEAYAEANGHMEETVQAASESFSSLGAFLREQDNLNPASSD